jgi:Spy/CpxP family protein refolding chaperone
MKVYKICTVAAAALAGLLAVTNASAARDTNTTPRVERRGPTVQQRVERMTTELQLNDDQKTKVTALLEKQAKERREIMGDSTLPREDRRDKMRALTEDENKQLKTILTSEQFEKWQKLREQMRARRPGGPAQPGVAAPAPAPVPKTPDIKSQ